MTSLTFDLGHISNLNGNVKEALKSSIFVVQKAAAPKTGVEFRQGSNGTIRSSLATSYDVSRRRARSPTFDQSEASELSQTEPQKDRTTKPQRINMLSGPALQAVPAKIRNKFLCFS